MLTLYCTLSSLPLVHLITPGGQIKSQNHPIPPTAKALPSSFWAKEPAKTVASAIPTANHFQRQNRCSIFCHTSLKADLKKQRFDTCISQPAFTKVTVNYSIAMDAYRAYTMLNCYGQYLLNK